MHSAITSVSLHKWTNLWRCISVIISWEFWTSDVYLMTYSIQTPLNWAAEYKFWGTGIRGLMRGMATLPQGNQEPLVVRDSWKTPGELGVSKSMECDIFPSVFWHGLLGDRKDIRPVKKWMLDLLVVMIWLELCTTYSSCSPVVTTHHLHHPLLQETPANPGSPGKWPFKRR